MLIKLLILLSYFVILFLIGYWSSKKVSDIKDFYVGGKKLGFWVVAFSVRATGESYTQPVIEFWNDKQKEFEPDLLNLADESTIQIVRASPSPRTAS